MARTRNRAARALAFLIALVVLFVSLSAEAKKKKPAKKSKTPTSKSKSKEAAPESETDEASSDEKSSGKDSDADEKTTVKAAPPPPPPDDEEMAAKKPVKPAKAPPKAESEAAGGAPIAFRFGVGGRALFRKVSWTDDNGAVAPYSLSPGPEASVWLEAFPAAFMTDGFAANIGLFGRFDYGFGAASKLPTGATLTTKYQDFLVGLKIRFPVGMFIPYVAGGYAMQKFHLEPVDVTRPNFNYSMVSGGAGTRIQFTPALDLDLSAAFLYVLNPGSSAGEVAGPGLYTRATANGVDVSMSIGFRVISQLGVRVGGDFRQLGVATNWKTGDAAIRAGGATDRNISVWGGLELIFDGVGGGGGGGEGEEAVPAKKKAPPPKGKKPPAEDGEPEVGTED